MKTNRVKKTLRRVLALTLAIVSVLSMEVITSSADFVPTTELKKNNEELDFKLITHNTHSLGTVPEHSNSYSTYLKEYYQEIYNNPYKTDTGYYDYVDRNDEVTAASLAPYSTSTVFLSAHDTIGNERWAQGLDPSSQQRYDGIRGIQGDFLRDYSILYADSSKNADTGAQTIKFLKDKSYNNNYPLDYYYHVNWGLSVPFVLEVTVPANSTYEVEYVFDISASSNMGEYSVCLLNGDCNKTCEQTTTYASGDILSSKHAMAYMSFEDGVDAILTVENDPKASLTDEDYKTTTSDWSKANELWNLTGDQSVASEKFYSSSNAQGCAYKSFTYINESDQPQKFTRTFALLVTHQVAHSDSAALLHGYDLIKKSNFNGEMNVAVNSIRKSNGSVELRDTATADSALLENYWFCSIPGFTDFCTYAEDKYLRMGDSVDFGAHLKQYEEDAYNEEEISVEWAKMQEYFKVREDGTYNATLNTSGSIWEKDDTGQINLTINEEGSTEQLRVFAIPITLSMNVPGDTIYSASFRLDLSVSDMSNCYTVALLDADYDLKQWDSYLENYKDLKMSYGGRNADTIGALSYVLSNEQLDIGKTATMFSDRLDEDASEAGDTFYKTFVFDNTGNYAQSFRRTIYLVVASNRYLPEEIIDSLPCEDYPEFYTRTGNVTLKIKRTGVNKLDLSTKSSADDGEEAVGGNTLNWSKKSSEEMEELLKAVSDCDYHTAAGWERLLLSSSFYNALVGQVTDSGTGTVQNDYIHPLGDYLKYAWLYNGTYSYPGALGSDYLQPEADLCLTRVNSNNFEYAAVAYRNQEYSCTTDLDSLYIKYAGEVNGKPTYFLAMEGVDGKRYLLVNRFDVVGTGECEAQQVLITAAEFDAHPELYSTAYGWPTGTAGAAALKSGDECVHTYKGLWQQGSKASGDCNIVADGLTEEAFAISISGNLQWSLNYDSTEEEVWSLSNTVQVDKESLENCSLYQYFKSVDRSSDNEEVKRFLEYEPEMKNCISKLQGNNTAVKLCFVEDNGVTHLRELDVSKDGFKTMTAILGIYEDASKTDDINIGEGETMTVTGTTHIQKGQTLTVGKGGTLEVRGVLINDGSIVCYGTTRIESGGCIRDAVTDPQGTYYFYGSTVIVGSDGVFNAGYTTWTHLKFTGCKIFNDGVMVAPAGVNVGTSIIENGSNGVIITGGALRKNLDVYSARELAESVPRGTLNNEQILTVVKETMVAYGKNHLGKMMSYVSSEGLKAVKEEDLTYSQPYFGGDAIIHNNGAIYCLGGYNLADALKYGSGAYYDFYSLATYVPEGSFDNLGSDMLRYGFLYGWASGLWSESYWSQVVQNSEKYSTCRGNFYETDSEDMVDAFDSQRDYLIFIDIFTDSFSRYW